MNARWLATPWANNAHLYSAPGHLIMKLALGEAPDTIPTSDDVRAGALAAADRLDGGPIDRILRHFGGQPRIVRVHSAAAALGHRGRQHTGYDYLEHTLGLSRIFRVDTEPTAHIGNLIDSLRRTVLRGKCLTLLSVRRALWRARDPRAQRRSSL